MGFLLFMDALGIQKYYNKGVEFANPIMERIIRTAKNIFNNPLPATKISMKEDSTNKLCIMNDTIFVYSNQLTNLLYFSKRFLKSMFIPKTNTDPIIFRGAITETKKPPKIVSKKDKDIENISISKLVIDNISSVLFVEKEEVLGARILIHKDIVGDKYKEWDLRYGICIMDIQNIKNIYGELENRDGTNLLLRKELKDYYDLAWMIVSDEKQEKKIYENMTRFWVNAVFDKQASLHASATMALLRVSQEKKKRLINYFNKIYNGQKKIGTINFCKPKTKEFKEWYNCAKRLKKNLENGFYLNP